MRSSQLVLLLALVVALAAVAVEAQQDDKVWVYFVFCWVYLHELARTPTHHICTERERETERER
jgi:hypothetical protein